MIMCTFSDRCVEILNNKLYIFSYLFELIVNWFYLNIVEVIIFMLLFLPSLIAAPSPLEKTSSLDSFSGRYNLTLYLVPEKKKKKKIDQ